MRIVKPALYVYFACLPFDIFPTSIGVSAASLMTIPLVGLWIADHLLNPRPIHIPRMLAVPAVLLLGVALLTYIWSVDQSRTFSSIVSLSQVVVVSLILVDVISLRDLPRTMLLLALSSALLSVLLIVSGSVSATGRLGLGVDENITAFVLTSGFSGAVYLVASNRFRIVAVLAGTVIAVCVVATGSRTGLVVLGAVVVVLIVTSFRRSFMQSLLIALLSLLFGYGVFLLITTWGGAPDRLSELVSGNQLELSGRDDIHAVYWSRMSEWVIFGIGYGADVSYITSSGGEAFNVHNTFLRLWVESGIVGLFALCALLVGVFCARRGALLILLVPSLLFGLTLGGLEQKGAFWIPIILAWVSGFRDDHSGGGPEVVRTPSKSNSVIPRSHIDRRGNQRRSCGYHSPPRAHSPSSCDNR